VTIRYVDPRAEPSRAAEPYTLSLDIASKPVTLGLIANSFPDATRFMNHVEATLRAAIPTLDVLHYTKPDTSPARADMRLEIARKCDAVISAYGH
jgi:hypothetical protein